MRYLTKGVCTAVYFNRIRECVCILMNNLHFGPILRKNDPIKDPSWVFQLLTN